MSARPHTLRRRLAWLIVAVVALAVAPIAGISAWRNGAREVELETARLTVAAQVVAGIASEATAHADPSAAFAALRAIAQMKDIEYGRIETKNGKLLTETGYGARLVDDTRVDARHDAFDLSQLFDLGRLFSHTSEVAVPVIFRSAPVGRVVLLGRTTGMLWRFLITLGESLAVAAIAVAIGIGIAWRVRERIVRPIVSLTDAMRTVQDTHEFNRRVDIAADGEVGELVTGFDRMLSEIRVRDDRIAAHMAGLENEVAARTSELVAAKEAAETANHAKSDFLATMSHEIRTPMNGVMVMAEMIAAGDLAPRERHFAEVIVKSGASLLAIINDILDFSKMEAGKLELESVPVDPCEIVDDVLSLFWDRAASKGLDLAGYIDPAVPETIAGDPVRLRQVISNLVNNAIKFTESGGVLVEVGLAEDGRLRIAVRDTGIGIEEAKLGSVFGAFTQADQSTTRRFGGTGLGLAICKKIVDAMGGEWHVASTPGEGSTFSFGFAAPVVTAAAAWPGASAPSALAKLAHDGIFTRDALRRYLNAATYTLAAENDASAAIAFGSPDGLRRLTTPPSAAICLGSYGDSSPDEMLRQGAVDAILPLPLQRHEVVRMLRAIEAGQSLTDVATTAARARAGGEALPSFAGARVLVADDSAVNREVALEALRRLDIEAKLVASGAAAIEAIAAERFDAVLMDGSMPEMSGYEATAEIRRREQAEHAPRVPVIALTAHVVGAAADAWRDAGMDAVLHKPFTLKMLAEVLSPFLGIGADAAAVAAPDAAVVPPAANTAKTAAPIGMRAEHLFDQQVVAQLEIFAASGRGDFVERVVGLYRENAPRCIADMCGAAGASDAAGFSAASHALKSMSYSIGAKAVASAAAEFEAAGLKGTIPGSDATSRLRALVGDTLAALAEAA